MTGTTDPVATRRDLTRQAFEVLALPHLPHLYTLAARLVASGGDARTWFTTPT